MQLCICSGSCVGGVWVCWACHQPFRPVIQGKINRPLMKPLNHQPVKTADQRLRVGQAWLEAYWSRLREALEPSHFRLTIHCTIERVLTTLLPLNTSLTHYRSLSQLPDCAGEFFKSQFKLSPLFNSPGAQAGTYCSGCVCVSVCAFIGLRLKFCVACLSACDVLLKKELGVSQRTGTD